MPDEAIDLEYLADNLWLVGSPGRSPTASWTFRSGPEASAISCLCPTTRPTTARPWVRSLRLLVEEVLPACAAADVRHDAVAGGLSRASSRWQPIRLTRW